MSSEGLQNSKSLELKAPQTVCDLFHSARRALREHPFKPHPLLLSGHLQTIVSSQLIRKFPWGWQHSEKSFLDLRDGARIRMMTVWRPEAPNTLVALHGMGGSSDSLYMQAFSHKAFREGWNSILLNLYDENTRSPRPRVFHAGVSEELDEILHSLRFRLNLGNILLVGVSMGGNILLKLLGEWGENVPLEVKAAATISPLVDLTVSWQTLERPSNFIYQRYFMRRLKELVRDRSECISQLIDMGAFERARTIREFDECFTAPLSGFSGAFDYYRRASALPHLGKIRVPTLLLHSRDDPLLPWEPFSRPEIQANPWLFPVLLGSGGHAAFVERSSRGDIDRCWAENRVIDFFRCAIQAK